MAGETVTTSKIVLPKEVAQGIVKKARDTSVVQTLSTATPALFKDIQHMVFTTEPEAEFVGEGDQKSPSAAAFSHGRR